MLNCSKRIKNYRRKVKYKYTFGFDRRTRSTPTSAHNLLVPFHWSTTFFRVPSSSAFNIVSFILARGFQEPNLVLCRYIDQFRIELLSYWS